MLLSEEKSFPLFGGDRFSKADAVAAGREVTPFLVRFLEVFLFPMNFDTARSIFKPSSRFITVKATRSAIVCSRECESIMRIARVFDLPKVLPPASDQRCDQDERPGSTITATTVASATNNTSEPILVGTLEKPIQPDQQQQPPPPSQPQQHVWMQGFEKLLEDPLGLRAFAVSSFFFILLFVI